MTTYCLFRPPCIGKTSSFRNRVGEVVIGLKGFRRVLLFGTWEKTDCIKFEMAVTSGLKVRSTSGTTIMSVFLLTCHRELIQLRTRVWKTSQLRVTQNFKNSANILGKGWVKILIGKRIDPALTIRKEELSAKKRTTWLVSTKVFRKLITWLVSAGCFNRTRTPSRVENLEILVNTHFPICVVSDSFSLGVGDVACNFGTTMI